MPPAKRATPQPTAIGCTTITTQAELDALLTAQQQGSTVCIHVRGDAEASVLEWQAGQQANG
jgi:hypothetical protein